MAGSRKILLVDEDAQARDALERALVQANYRAVSALNGADALRQIQKHSIDIAVLGLGQDAEHAWSIVQLLSQSQPHLRLIIAGAGAERFAHPLAATAEALLEKPVDVPLLLETLRGVCAAPSRLPETRSAWSVFAERSIESARPAILHTDLCPHEHHQTTNSHGGINSNPNPR